MNYHRPVAVQPNDMSLGFKAANACNTDRATGNFERVIDIECIDLHIKVKGAELFKTASFVMRRPVRLQLLFLIHFSMLRL